MKRNSGDVIWQSFLFKSLVVSGILIFSKNQALAQVIPDNTLGNENSVVNPRDETSDSIDGGAIQGQNLFHSFQEFNVDAGRGVYFANPDDVTNIFSRVTGNNVSNILGTLGVDGAADLFLINPNGIIFGEGASLDVQGSFAATTASGIEFGNNGLFSASVPESSLLTIGVPLGLQLDNNPGNIVNRSGFQELENGDIIEESGLKVNSGEKITLVGGNIILDNGRLTAPGGNIELGAFREAGTVTFNGNFNLSFSDELTKADVSLIGFAEIDVTSGGSGNIAIFAKNINILDSSDICAGIGSDDACGNRNSDVGYLNAQAGDITFRASDIITIDGQVSKVNNNVNPGSRGNAGDINITSNSLVISNTAQILSVVEGHGSSGNINIKTSNISLADGGDIFAGVFDIGQGNSGDIVINSDQNISLSNDSDIANVINSMGVGNTGDLIIRTSNLEINGGSQISNAVLGQGNSGNLIIDVQDLISIDGENINLGFNSGIFASVDPGASGNGGNININTANLTITNGGEIDASLSGQGTAGNITINATDTILLDGTDQLADTNGFRSDSGIFTNVDLNDAFDSDAIGNGGDINIKASNLLIFNGADISANSEGEGSAGNINLKIQNDIEILNGSVTAASNQDFGGSIVVSANNVILQNNSDISSFVLSGQAGGGEVSLTANSIIAFDDSDIFAFATDGQGGNITLNTPAFFAENFTLNSLSSDPEDLEDNNRADVNATGAVSGAVDLPDVSFIQNSLTELPDNSINTNELVANSCVSPLGNRQQGKFIITGVDSLPVRPGNADISNFSTGEVSNISDNNSGWQRGEPIVEPQGVYRLANGKLVLSRECSNNN